jgi:mannose-1-phosphate guanylyltransferase
MKAIILVGGEGTRLRPLTYITPKAMMPILNIPFIYHVVNYLKRHGVDTVVLSMGYKPDPIQKYFESNKPRGVDIIYNIESIPLGTAGAVKFAQKYIEPGETFYVLNGDIFTDMNLTEMRKLHQERGAKVSIALTAVEDPSMFGVVEIDNNNRILRFVEKPKKEEAPSNLINAGIYLMNSLVLDMIPENRFFMFEHSVFPQLVAANEPVFGYISGSYWIDMGNPQKYRQLNCDLLSGKCKPGVKDRSKGLHIDSGRNNVDNTSRVAKNARLVDSAIGPGCDIGDGCIIERSIVWSDVKIGRSARIKNSIIASGCIVEDNASIEDRVIVKE